MNDLIPEQSGFLLYTSKDGAVKVDVFVQDETAWLTQNSIALLFGVQRSAITKHLKNIFESGELLEDSVSSILELTANDGKTYKTKFYNLDAIISVHVCITLLSGILISFRLLQVAWSLMNGH